jgi:hypothetical protein
MHVQRRQFGIDRQTVDAGLLGGFAQRGGDDVGVGLLAVPAQLQPPAEPWVQRQQRVAGGVVEDECGAGDMTRHAATQAAVGPCGEERQHRVPQRVLRGIGCAPIGQHCDGRLVQAHLRTSRSSVGTGSRGPDGSCG